MPCKRQINVLSDLKSMSDEVDQVAQDCIKVANIAGWLDVCQQIILKIRDCPSVEDLQAIHYPDTIILVSGAKSEKRYELEGLQIEKIHSKKRISVPIEVIEDKKILSAVVNLTPCDKIAYTAINKEKKLMPSLMLTKSGENFSDRKCNEKTITPLPLPCTKNNPLVLLKKIETLSNYCENSKTKSDITTETSVVSKTYNKIADVTAAVDSGQKSKLLKEKNDSRNISESKKITLKTTENEDNCARLTHSDSKRKSSLSNNESNKKQKINALETPVKAAKKTVKTKHPLLKKNNSQSSLVSTPKNKSKMSAAIMPPLQTKYSRVSKEQQILEEIKKKEDKAKSNIKRVLSERHEKAELSKKNEEEKRQKAHEKRMQLKKEKEKRLKQESSEIKLAKEYAGNPSKKRKTQEVTEHHEKEKKSLVSNSATKNNGNVDTVFKTPKSKKSDVCESYELTPMPNSSTYNFSDDEDEKPSGKPIPLWAQGLHLKSALIHQVYSSVDPISIFGSRIDSPNLVQIFKKDKKTYKKRTSSAIWNSKLDLSVQC